MNLRYITLNFTLLFCISLIAQKKELDHSVYDTWKSLTNLGITNDGKYGVAIVKEQEGDDYLFVKDLQSHRQMTVPRGYKYSISPDQKYILTHIKAPYERIRQAKIKKIEDEKLPKDSLAIVSLENLIVQKIPSVKDFITGKDSSDYIAYTLDDTIKVKDKKELKAQTLILRNLYSAAEDTIPNVTEYIFSTNGKVFSAIIKPNPKDSTLKNEVLYIDLDRYKKSIVSQGKMIYKNIALSKQGGKLAFLATSDSLKKEVKDYSLYYYDTSTDSANVIADKNKYGMPDNWCVSENYSPVFSKNEKRLLVGIAPIVLPKDTTIPDFEKAQLDIWHWQEPTIQPMQLVQLDKKLKQSYLSYINLENTSRLIQLGSEEIPEIIISDENNGRYAIGISDLNYKFEQQWDIKARSTIDVWLFDLEKNTQKKIKTKLEGKTRFSPLGNYLVWYNLNDKQYYAYASETGKEVCLTKGLNVNFWDEKFDMPTVPNAYGLAAWMENDEALLVYDAYDIWKLDPNGKEAKNLTKGIGRDRKITLRYIKTDPESRFILKDENLLLSAFNNTTKENGYYEWSKSGIKDLVMDKFTYPMVVKAKDRDVYCFVKNNFNTSPDLYVSSDKWKTETKLMEINPQMRDYNWGTAELTSWTTFDGKPTQGILYKPEGFDPNKKYPVMIYFYEQHSDNLYQYMAPLPSRSIINIPFYCSRGYIVFTPDIKYTTGHPGASAYNSIVSGAEMLTQNSWVDKDNMAIQGQSWGGYQVAYLVTRTNRRIGSSRIQYVQCIRRYSLAIGNEQTIPIRANSVAYRGHNVGSPRTV